MRRGALPLGRAYLKSLNPRPLPSPGTIIKVANFANGIDAGCPLVPTRAERVFAFDAEGSCRAYLHHRFGRHAVTPGRLRCRVSR